MHRLNCVQQLHGLLKSCPAASWGRPGDPTGPADRAASPKCVSSCAESGRLPLVARSVPRAWSEPLRVAARDWWRPSCSNAQCRKGTGSAASGLWPYHLSRPHPGRNGDVSDCHRQPTRRPAQPPTAPRAHPTRIRQPADEPITRRHDRSPQADPRKAAPTAPAAIRGGRRASFRASETRSLRHASRASGSADSATPHGHHSRRRVSNRASVASRQRFLPARPLTDRDWHADEGIRRAPLAGQSCRLGSQLTRPRPLTASDVMKRA